MSRFDRYMLSQLMMLFGFFALILVAVYWVNRAVTLFDQLISDGQSALVFLEFTALTLPNVIRLVLPVAAFVATVNVTNRLSAESELVVMQATGFSPFRLARPVLYFGVIVGAMLAVLVLTLVPASRATLAERRDEISENIANRFLVEAQFIHPASGITFYIREISAAGELHDIFLADARDDAVHTTYTAERAVLVRSEEGPRLVMFDGMAQRFDRKARGLSVTRFDDFSYDVGALVAGGKARRPQPDELPTRQLLWPDRAVTDLTGKSAEDLRLVAHGRISEVLLGPAAALIGFATLLLGGFSRHGLARQIAGAVFLLILLQLLVNAGARLGGGSPALWPVVYLPGLTGLATGALLLSLAGRERRKGPAFAAAVAS
ncbi:MAG: LPS export ABC transporter permease LptF [Rhodobacteraceae bacterium]|nr:LPS export ABC transporter permease LptF [Paracoccaceae bacterium]